MVALSEHVRQLLEEPNFVFVATLMADGTPQVTPVWIDIDGEHILFNTARGRQKTRNMERDPRVTLSVTDRNNPYDWAEIRGRVVELTGEGAEAHIDKMARKYLNQETYPFRQPGEERVLARILPEKISTAQG